MPDKYDIAFLGAGPGGYVAAIRASQLGLKVCVIEKNKAGGVCLNIGCIPSKTLIHQAEVFETIKELKDIGITCSTEGFDYKKVYKKSRRAADMLSKGINFLLKKNNIDFISGTGTIKDKNSISVNSGDTVSADNIVIATGSRPREIPGFEFDGKKILSSDHILMQDSLPESIVILGAGAIGSEFAYILSSFGVNVTIVEMLDQILPTEEKEIAEVVAASFRKKKIKMYTSTKAIKQEKTEKGISVSLETPDGPEEVEASQLLVVVGRVPNTENIGLDNAGIDTERGFIPVQDYYETKVNGIYAIGDVTSSPLLAHVASKEGEIAVEHIAGHETIPQINPDLIPGAVYTNPGIASFGLKEDEVKEKNIPYKSFIFPYRGIGKAVAIDKKEGMVKVICSEDTGEILGAHIAGEQATELIHELLLAKNSELLPADLAGMIHAHPTLSESVMEVMRGIEGWAIHI